MMTNLLLRRLEYWVSVQAGVNKHASSAADTGDIDKLDRCSRQLKEIGAVIREIEFIIYKAGKQVTIP